MGYPAPTLKMHLYRADGWWCCAFLKWFCRAAGRRQRFSFKPKCKGIFSGKKEAVVLLLFTFLPNFKMI